MSHKSHSRAVYIEMITKVNFKKIVDMPLLSSSFLLPCFISFSLFNYSW